MSQAQAVTLTILERDYHVSCMPEERAGLLEAAALLDAKMREIRGASKLIALERIAVMAALNIAHESLQAREELKQLTGNLGDELKRLNAKLDGALHASLK